MTPAEIIALISLIIAVPPFFKMIHEFIFKNSVKLDLVGCETDGEKVKILSIQVINRSNSPFSITNLKINKNSTLIQENNKFVSPINKKVEALGSPVILINCFDTKIDELINIKLYTTKRRRAYKLKIKSYIEFLRG